MCCRVILIGRIVVDDVLTDPPFYMLLIASVYQWGWCGTTSEYCSGGGTVPSPSPPTSLLGDWAFCSSSSQCLNKCCSKEYSTSDGKYKVCT